MESCCIPRKASSAANTSATSALTNASLRGDWNMLKDKLQQAYAHLTDEDLTYVEGKGHELVSRLQAKLGKRKRQIIKLLNAL